MQRILWVTNDTQTSTIMVMGKKPTFRITCCCCACFARNSDTSFQRDSFSLYHLLRKQNKTKNNLVRKPGLNIFKQTREYHRYREQADGCQRGGHGNKTFFN